MNLFSRLYSFILNLTRSSANVAGLEVSDAAIRYALWKKNGWRFEEILLPAGTMVRGVVQSEPALMTALHALHDRVARGKRSRVSVVVSLSSAPVYSQTFAIPRIADNELEKAVNLNMQMNSPLSLEESSSGWQVLRSTPAQVEVLTASVPNGVMSVLMRVLSAAGFVPMALEARSFSIARTVRTWVPGFSADYPYLVVLVDDMGLSVLIVQQGFLYFEYSSPWADIQGEAASVSLEVFDAALARHVSQVLNYHRQHSAATFKEALVIAPSMQDHIVQALSQQFGLPARVAQVGDGSFPLQWFVAIGAGARGSLPRWQDVEVNLVGISARKAFHEEQVALYLGFWRVMVPASLGVLLVTTLIGYIFVSRSRAALETQAAALPEGAQVEELDRLEARAEQFNKNVANLHAIQADIHYKSPIAQSIHDIASRGGITLVRLYIAPVPQPSMVSGFGPSEATVLAFKNTLQADPRFTDVALPITEIRTTPQGISFSMTFRTDFPASVNTP